MTEAKWVPDGRVSPEGKRYGHKVVVRTPKTGQIPEEPPAFFPEGSSTEKHVTRGDVGNYNADIISAAEDEKADKKNH